MSSIDPKSEVIVLITQSCRAMSRVEYKTVIFERVRMRKDTETRFGKNAEIQKYLFGSTFDYDSIQSDRILNASRHT